MEEPLQRVFLAIDPNPWKNMLEQWQVFLQQNLAINSAKCIWSKKIFLHVTLLFLGELPAVDVARLESVLQQFDFKEKIQLKIHEIGLLNKNHIVVYLENDNLTALHQALLDYVNLHEIPVKKVHQFIPHITLGRIKDLTIKETVIQYFQQIDTHQLQTVKIQKLVLYQSFTGSHYEILKQYSL